MEHSSNQSEEIETVLYEAILAAIKQVGSQTFLATSLFASNERKEMKKAA